MKKKSDLHLGLEKLLNDKNASPLTNPAVYKQLIASTNQPLSQTLKYLGKGHKNQQKEDSDRAKERLQKLEGDTPK
jgi:hypothetical protein